MAELKPVLAGSTSLSPVGASSSSCILPRKQPLYPCSIADALFSEISNSVLLKTFSPVAVYGSVGFVSLSLVASTPETRPLWKQCTNLCYCDGPSYEGNTVGEFDRYKTRWLFQFDSGFLSYGVVGEPLVRLLSLFPTAVEYDSFSACFDQNAKPVVVFGLGTTVELRRTQAGVYTSYSFTGESPVLFQNALLQPDLDKQDVVCYYLRSGNLCGRWQRDNFEVEHVLVTDVEVDSLFSVRTSTLSYNTREFLFCQKSCSTRLIVSDRYPPWPFFASDLAEASVTCVDGIHRRVVVDVGSYDDNAVSSIGPLNGVHRAVVVTLPTASDSVASSIGVVTGAHKLVLVTLATESDSATSTIGPLSGVHKFVVIQAGTYNDSVTSTIAPLTGVHRHV